MSPHLSNQAIERYRLRQLRPTELLDVDDHIAICEQCRERLFFESGLAGAAGLLQTELMSLPGLIPRHMGYRLSALYVDAQLTQPDLELVQEHLDSCIGCAADLCDLVLFKQELEREHSC